jgi:hypothetical protein
MKTQIRPLKYESTDCLLDGAGWPFNETQPMTCHDSICDAVQPSHDRAAVMYRVFSRVARGGGFFVWRRMVKVSAKITK